MSGFNDNPFADPQSVSPFNDPSIQRATQQPAQSGMAIEDYNPFENRPLSSHGQAGGLPTGNTAITMPPDPAKKQPALMQPVDPAAKQAKITTEELQRRQEELDRKAADLEAREEALRNGTTNVKAHNWPPLPSFCPIQPCFYQDIGVDIPLEFQSIVRTMYYLWFFYFLLLTFNFFGCLALLLKDISNVTMLGISIFSLVVYVPLSFIGWFRPIYRAFRSDSSLNFMIFFLVFTVQVVFSIVSTIGIADYGAVGVITAVNTFKENTILGIFMAAISVFQGLFALTCFIMLMRVHRLYRGTTASFQRAQAEFATGVLRNEHVQQAAANVAAEAARTTVQNSFSGSRY